MSETNQGSTSGLTVRALVAIVLCAAILTPAILYYQLVLWLGLPFSVWLILIIYSELWKGFRKPLTTQEAFLISSFAPIALLGWGGIGGALFFYNLMLNHWYFPNSPITESFGLANAIPSWYVVPGTFVGRTFVDFAWLVPIAVSMMAFIVYLGVAIITGLISFRIYAMEEKLDFPIQSAMASGYSIIVDPTPSRERKVLYSAAFLGGLIYFFTFVIPALFPSLFPLAIFYSGLGSFVSIPWIDLNRYVEVLGFSGGSLALPLDLFSYAAGLLIPLPVALLVFLSNFLIYFVGNHLLVRYELWTSGIGAWQPGVDVMYCTYWSQLRFWNSAAIGLVLALSVVPFLRHSKRIVNAFVSSSGSEQARRLGIPSMRTLVIGYTFVAISSIVLVKLLAPSFPLEVLALFTFIWPLLGTLASTNVAGVTSTSFYVPMFKETMLIGVGYTGLDMYLMSLSNIVQFNNIAGSDFAASLKQATITRTSILEYTKAFALAVVLSLIFGFIYMQLFWQSAPIPSPTFPATVSQWPLAVMFRSLWLKYMTVNPQLVFRGDLLAGAFVVGSIAYLATDSLGLTYVLPAMMGGFISIPPTTAGMLIGSIIGHVVLRRIYRDRDQFSRNSAYVVTGFSIGGASMLTITAAFLIVKNALSSIPY